MLSPVIPQYTAHLHGAPGRRHWPLVILGAVGITAMIAAVSFVGMIIGLLT